MRALFLFFEGKNDVLQWVKGAWPACFWEANLVKFPDAEIISMKGLIHVKRGKSLLKYAVHFVQWEMA